MRIKFIDPRTQMQYQTLHLGYREDQVVTIVNSPVYQGAMDKEAASSTLTGLPNGSNFIYFDSTENDFYYYSSKACIPFYKILAHSRFSQLDEKSFKKSLQLDIVEDLLSEIVPSIQQMLFALFPAMNVARLPHEYVHRLADKFLNARDTLSLALSQRHLIFGDAYGYNAGLRELAIQKKIRELEYRVVALPNGGALFNHNTLYIWGKLFDGSSIRKVPTKFDLSQLHLVSDTVIDITGGDDYFMLLTDRSRCFAWGNNESGQLGVGDLTNRTSPTEVDLTTVISNGDRIIKIACGDRHSCFLTEQGQVFVCGLNSSGELGLGDNTDRPILTKLDLTEIIPIGDRVTDVECGSGHTVLLTEQGNCFACGNNSDGQLGVGHTNDINIPTRVDLPLIDLAQDGVVTNIKCGSSHTLFHTNKGDIYGCGSNVCSQLGLPRGGVSNININFPIKAKLNLDPDEQIKKITCGHWRTLILTTRGNLISWGHTQLNSDYLNCLNLTDGDSVEDVFSEQSHSILITKHGRCFVWGSNYTNRNYELGTGDNKARVKPTEILMSVREEIQKERVHLQQKLLSNVNDSSPAQDVAAAAAAASVSCVPSESNRFRG